MSNNNIKNKLKKSSKKDTTWINEAKYRRENEEWLDLSFKIAVKIMAALKNNKAAKVIPGTQVELAKELGCSPQYINKVLKGSENLQLETITKLQSILGVKLIEIPETITIPESIGWWSSHIYKDLIKNIEVDLSHYTDITSILVDKFNSYIEINQCLNNNIRYNALENNLKKYQVKESKATMKIIYNQNAGETSYNPKKPNSKLVA